MNYEKTAVLKWIKERGEDGGIKHVVRRCLNHGLSDYDVVYDEVLLVAKEVLDE